MRRVLWLTFGFGLGVLLTLRAQRTIRATVDRYVPVPVTERARTLNAALEQRRTEIRLRKAAARAQTAV
jgi:hypothetical protein